MSMLRDNGGIVEIIKSSVTITDGDVGGSEGDTDTDVLRESFVPSSMVASFLPLLLLLLLLLLSSNSTSAVVLTVFIVWLELGGNGMRFFSRHDFTARISS